MKKIMFIAFLALSCSSDADKPLIDEEEITRNKESAVQNELWICHHPGTVFHGKVCVEETYPKGCYVSGDSSKFCWLMLKDEDCPGSEKDLWAVYCD